MWGVFYQKSTGNSGEPGGQPRVWTPLSVHIPSISLPLPSRLAWSTKVHSFQSHIFMSPFGKPLQLCLWLHFKFTVFVLGKLGHIKQKLVQNRWWVGRRRSMLRKVVLDMRSRAMQSGYWASPFLPRPGRLGSESHAEPSWGSDCSWEVSQSLRPSMNLGPLHWEPRVLATRPPGKSQGLSIWSFQGINFWLYLYSLLFCFLFYFCLIVLISFFLLALHYLLFFSSFLRWKVKLLLWGLLFKNRYLQL